MDEPFGALDSQTRQPMQELPFEVCERDHKTVPFVTHDIGEAVLLADIVHVMTARPRRIERSLPVDIPRPRGAAALTSAKFNPYKREIMGPMREKSLRAARS